MIDRILKLTAFALILLPWGVSAHMAEKDNLQIIHPWTEVADKGGNATVHLTFMNRDDQKTYVITGAETKASRQVRFMQDGEETERISLQPGTMLSDDTLSVKLVNLKKPLKKGEIIAMTLQFQDDKKLDFKLGVGKQTMPDSNQE